MGKQKKKDDKTVTEIFTETIEQMCDHYCKYPIQHWNYDDEMIETVCQDCPLNKLGV